jgi:hypothetical protein
MNANELLKTMTGRVAYECKQCGWSGDTPSISDLSELNEAGGQTRRHIVVCPRCMDSRFIRPKLSTPR